MANNIDIPMMSPLKFYELDPVTNALYNWKHMDRYWFEEQILSYQQDVKWSQPWQKSDTIPLQFSANYAPIQVDWLTCSGANVPGMSFGAALKSTLYVEPGYQKSEVEMALDILDEGYYFVLMTVGSGDATRRFITDRQHILEKHENSLYLQWKNGRNKDDVAFDTGIEFNLRIPAVLDEFTPGADEVAFKDQPRNVTTLSSVSFRQYKLILGDARGFPPYMSEIVNDAFGCSSKKLDAVAYARNDGAKMERNGDPLYPMAAWRLDVVEAMNRRSVRFSSEGTGEDELSVAYDIETKMFGAFNAPASSNVVRVYKVE
jgi:hypothetical protein